ncbi:hypothetical protein J2S43_007127 [Catenuloplanes nepalensis]|uniref:Uncharacterized protein n=1 Tax=Catenuloplanes nepalensis TaxID=587533 RepID=A0ABT9N4Y8_9ACTN|nr:hypothetical protein [Catenuloplanes nepalensis]MDP9798615.1 hypothetical protein [Catenuloplanes nepalensis]
MSAETVDSEKEAKSGDHPIWCDPAECWMESVGAWHRSRMEFIQLSDALGTRVGIRLLRCTSLPDVTFVELEAYTDSIEEPVMELMLGAEDLERFSGLLDSVSRALGTEMARPVVLAIPRGRGTGRGNPSLIP